MNLDVSKYEIELVDAIVDRAAPMYRKLNVPDDRLTIYMDIVACHSNGCPLRLSELAHAAPGDFAHDIFGIRSHINRRTGQLEDCFVPRYAVQ
jgi:hypothetical protein